VVADEPDVRLLPALEAAQDFVDDAILKKLLETHAPQSSGCFDLSGHILFYMPPPKTCGAFSRLQHRAIELHDSKVLSVTEQGGAVHVRLNAYLHVSSGDPGRDAGTGWSQDVELVVASGAIRESPQSTLWILDGQITIDGAKLDLLPLPLAERGDIVIALNGHEGRLSVSGRGLAVVEKGEPVFVEKVPADASGD